MSFPIKITLNNPPDGYSAEAEIVAWRIPKKGEHILTYVGGVSLERGTRIQEFILRLTKLEQEQPPDPPRVATIEEGPNEIVRFVVSPKDMIYGFDDLGGEWVYDEVINWVKTSGCEWTIETHLQQGGTEIFPQSAEPKPALPEGWLWADGLAFAPIDWGHFFPFLKISRVYHAPCENGRWVYLEDTKYRICGYSDEPNIRTICMSTCTHKANRRYAVLKVEDGQ